MSPKYEVGQEVRVFLPRQGRRADPDPEDGYKGEVIKVARKYMTVAWTRAGRDREVQFDMETGQERSDGRYSNYLPYVKTPEEVAQDLRRKQAKETLKSAGLEPIAENSRGRKKISLEQLEALAEVIDTHPAFTEEA